MRKIIQILFIIILAFSLVQASDTVKTPIHKNPTIKLPTDVKPKPATNWSKIKDLFL
jgi:hypothetical protein